MIENVCQNRNPFILCSWLTISNTPHVDCVSNVFQNTVGSWVLLLVGMDSRLHDCLSNPVIMARKQRYPLSSSQYSILILFLPSWIREMGLLIRHSTVEHRKVQTSRITKHVCKKRDHRKGKKNEWNRRQRPSACRQCQLRQKTTHDTRMTTNFKTQKCANQKFAT